MVAHWLYALENLSELGEMAISSLKKIVIKYTEHSIYYFNHFSSSVVVSSFTLLCSQPAELFILQIETLYLLNSND